MRALACLGLLSVLGACKATPAPAARERAPAQISTASSAAGAFEEELDLDPYLFLSRPEPLYWLPSEGLAAEDVLYALLSWHDPGPLPNHRIYQGLGRDVREALLRLNSWYRDDLLLHAESPLYLRSPEGSRSQMLSNGEGGGWVWSGKERLGELGVKVRWNATEALYELDR